MTDIRDAIYVGNVVHKRLRPLRHALSYRVFSLLVDCSRLSELDRRSRLFSYNRFNLFSIHDRDHGNGQALSGYLNEIATHAVNGDKVDRFMMLCYPRVAGYGFNPLTVYFGLGYDGSLQLVVYEVNNTFGQRRPMCFLQTPKLADQLRRAAESGFTYHPSIRFQAATVFRVSPLNEHNLTVGVALKDDDGAILKAYFRGERSEFNDKELLRALVATGWLSIKVIAAIHIEAAKLWLKGLRLVARPQGPKTPVSFISESKEQS